MSSLDSYAHGNEYLIDSFILAVEEYGAPEVDKQVRVLHQQRGLVVLGQVGEAVQVVRDPRDPLHGEVVAGDGGAGADRDPEHGAHDHLLDQLLPEVDGPVLVVGSSGTVDRLPLKMCRAE